jgi:endonuclease YncB( thermonuclease family)
MKVTRCTRFIPLLATLLFTAPSIADTLQGRVIAVTDGDTVKVLDASHTVWKIRLIGIDAPEKKQAFGTKSKSNLSDLVFGKTVAIEYSKKDKYGRTLGKILVNGVDANLEQVKAGMAWHYKKYAKEQPLADRETYAQAEEQARAGHLGLWSDAEPVPPWEWRKSKKLKKNH